MVWRGAAVEYIIRVMPMPVRKIHSNNKAEFINAHVQRFCQERGIEITRSRPYRKNDSAYVESKNWSMVRVYRGWRRYDTEEELEILKRLERLITLRHNLFMPPMKLIYKQREGGKVVKDYEVETPLNRVLNLEVVSINTKDKVVKLRNTIHILRLLEEIEKLTEKLFIVYEKKLMKYEDN